MAAKLYKQICLSDKNKNWRLYFCREKEFSSCRFEGTEKSINNLTMISAEVPGCFEFDFMRAGLLPENIYYSDNILKLQEMEDLHLFYVTDYTKKFENETLIFEGVDTLAEIYLNGEKVAFLDNMLISHEINITSKKGKNELVVHILPTVLEGKRYFYDREKLRFNIYNEESAHIRKAPHMFGWDIMPRAVSGGIWKDVYIIQKQDKKIEEFYIFTESISDDCAKLGVKFSISGFDKNYVLKVKGKCKNSVFEKCIISDKSENSFTIEVEHPELWYPRNYGDPNLYDIKVTLSDGELLIDEKKLRFGIRTASLKRTSVVKDGEGEFCFYVNGQKIYIMGTNWVPLDAFHCRDKEFLKKTFDLLLECNCNAVRCWGGNVYESDEFYDLCDENGILVWQDFSMACGIYPCDKSFCEAIKKETVSVVKRLRNHSSILLWAGDNECDIEYRFAKRDPNRENLLTREIIPSVLNVLDPIRTYLPSSPYIDEIAFSSGYSATEFHTWGDRSYFKGDYYANTECCFCSEMGFFGVPNLKSLKKFISQDQLWPWKDDKVFEGFDPEGKNFIDAMNANKAKDDWMIHSTCIETSLSPYSYRVPLGAYAANYLFPDKGDDLETFILKSQVAQMEGFKYNIERYRLSKWRRTGFMWWNLRDGWPEITEAVVDYYFEKKLVFEIIKRVQNPVLAALKEEADGKHAVVICNDLRENKLVKVKITDLLTDITVFEGEGNAISDKNLQIGDIPASDKFEFYKIEFYYDGSSYISHYANNLIGCDFDIYLKCLKKIEVDDYL